MIRVGLVISHFPSREHPYIWDWVKQLASQDIDITIITENILSGDNYQTDDTLSRRVVLLNSVASPLRSVVSNRGLVLRSVVRARRILATLKILKQREKKRRTIARKLYEYLPILTRDFDIIHFNGPQIAVRRLELGRIFGAKTLVSFRGQDFTFHPDRYDSLLREADHLHFISEHLIQEARKRGYDDSKHTLIPPMVDTDFYHPHPDRKCASEGPYTIFTAARFSWTKGWEYALQAIALLIERGFDIQYYIAGDGEFREAILYTIHELGLDERVHLLGWLSPYQIREWLWKSDLYLLASVEEAFNNSVLQAQACGVPVVCSDAGGLPENIVDGETGLLARRRDAWDMAEKIAYLREHPALAGIMSRLAVERAQQARYDRLNSRFIDLYYSLGK